MSLKKPTIDEVCGAVESALEGENRGSESFTDKWEAVEEFIPKKDRLKAVKALAYTFDSDWESNLQYVTDFDKSDE